MDRYTSCMLMTERDHCLKCGNISKDEGDHIYLNIVAISLFPWKSTATRGFVVAEICYMEHSLAYHNHTFVTCDGPETLISNTGLCNVM